MRLRRRARARDEIGPLLVLASGQRCGSTLVQRLLSSHPDVLIWGEHGGHLREIVRASSRIRAWNEGLSAGGREEFSRAAHQGWIANMLPPPARVDDAARAYARKLFAESAAELDRHIWGFKEVRLGFDDAAALRELFPGTRVIHLTRDPRRVLSSLDRWERSLDWPREYTELAVGYWVDVNESFAEGTRELDWVASWRYEDMVSGAERFVTAVAELTGLDAERFDRSVFDRRVSSYRDESPTPLRPFETLPEELRSLLDDDRIRAVAGRFGYDLAG